MRHWKSDNNKAADNINQWLHQAAFTVSHIVYIIQYSFSKSKQKKMFPAGPCKIKKVKKCHQIIYWTETVYSTLGGQNIKINIVLPLFLLTFISHTFSDKINVPLKK